MNNGGKRKIYVGFEFCVRASLDLHIYRNFVILISQIAVFNPLNGEIKKNSRKKSLMLSRIILFFLFLILKSHCNLYLFQLWMKLGHVILIVSIGLHYVL